jgi:hypothetical protein
VVFRTESEIVEILVVAIQPSCRRQPKLVRYHHLLLACCLLGQLRKRQLDQDPIVVDSQRQGHSDRAMELVIGGEVVEGEHTPGTRDVVAMMELVMKEGWDHRPSQEQ